MERPAPADEREILKRDALLLDGLRAALSGDEHRLFRSGKSDGLFSSRTGLPAEAAALAVREGLLEFTRTEMRGRFEIEWVRLTAKGVDYLYQHDSPRAILGELREMLAAAQSGVPMWQDDMLKLLERLGSQITEQMGRYLDKLDAVTKRVDEAIRRIDATPEVSESLKDLVSWGVDALAYLDRRRAGVAADDCALPELFGAIRGKHPEITMRDFHDGLRHLADNRAVKLLPWNGDGPMPQPEFAMMAHGKLVYLVRR